MPTTTPPPAPTAAEDAAWLEQLATFQGSLLFVPVPLANERRDALRAIAARLLAQAARPETPADAMRCEAHPDRWWPHEDCPGPGDPLVANLADKTARVATLERERDYLKKLVPMECCLGADPHCSGPRGCLVAAQVADRTPNDVLLARAESAEATLATVTRELDEARLFLEARKLDSVPAETWQNENKRALAAEAALATVTTERDAAREVLSGGYLLGANGLVVDRAKAQAAIAPPAGETPATEGAQS